MYPPQALDAAPELRIKVDNPQRTVLQVTPRTSQGGHARKAKNLLNAAVGGFTRSISSLSAAVDNDTFDDKNIRLKCRSGSTVSALSRASSHRSFGKHLSQIEDEWEREPEPDHCGNCIVMRQDNLFRRIWNVVLAILLVYTGTIFLYRLAFIECRIPLQPVPQDGWMTFDTIVNYCFWIDMFLNFLFSSEDMYGREVDSLRLIAQQYLSGMFWVNALACIPQWLTEKILKGILNSAESTQFGLINQAVRIARIQRVSRLARLMRLGRLARLMRRKRPTHPFWSWFQSLRGVRIINFVVGLMLAVHFLACGWYLCAALHDDYEETWVARRSVDAAEQTSLLEQGPLEQWFHAMYFVLTVFTTVGFGDMSAMTMGEIVYVSFTMIVGAVVHSIIISHVITIVTTADRTDQFVQQQQELVEAFAAHTELDQLSTRHMREWITFSARNWMSHRFDREEMKQLITCNVLPRWLLGRLPQYLFQEQLARSKFLAPLPGVDHVPPRLPLLLALSAHKAEFHAGEVVYQMYDVAWSIYLVLGGTFAHVALPGPRGGRDQEQVMLEPVDVQWKSSGKSLRSQGKHRVFDAQDAQAQKAQYERSVAEERLYPYQLFSSGDYFGDVEMQQEKVRSATTRCESAGAALLLRKESVVTLQEEFPRFGDMWRKAAQAHERARGRRLAKLTHGLTYQHLAAVRIQRWILPRLACAKPAHRHGGRHIRPTASGQSGAQFTTLLAAAAASRPAAPTKEPLGPPRKPEAAADELRAQLGATASPVLQELREMRAFMEGLRSSVDALRGDVGAMRRGEPPRAAASLECIAI